MSFSSTGNERPGRTFGIALGLQYSKRPSRPPSRPKPDSRKPPKPDAASKALWRLTQTVPALSLSESSAASAVFSVQSDAARPKFELLASLIASSGSRNGRATRTGPKISSCTHAETGATFVISVGG
eukprot:Amastigsp_a842540_113.p5 type:complete len:127 gc:universal Amastigsp_a842540_113:1629-1249(-)